jgi:hypothetical protein
VLDVEVGVLEETEAPRSLVPLQLDRTTAVITGMATAVTERLRISMRLCHATR